MLLMAAQVLVRAVVKQLREIMHIAPVLQFMEIIIDLFGLATHKVHHSWPTLFHCLFERALQAHNGSSSLVGDVQSQPKLVRV